MGTARSCQWDNQPRWRWCGLLPCCAPAPCRRSSTIRRPSWWSSWPSTASRLACCESAAKLKGPKDVAAAVKKNGSPEDKAKAATKGAFSELHKRMDKMEKTLDEVHKAVSSQGGSKQSPKVAKAE